MNIQLLSTVKQLRFEDANGVVLGSIQRDPRDRDPRGKCVLVGLKPTFSHWQVVVYNNPLRKEDRMFIAIKPAAAVRDTSPMRPTRAD